MRGLPLVLLFVSAAAAAQEDVLRRAVIERDQQSAEFAAGVRRSQLEALHQRQLLEATTLQEPAGYARARMTRERDSLLFQLPPPLVSAPRRNDAPLPLPGGPAHGVDPIPLQGLGG